MSVALRLVAHRLPHTASCVCAHSAPESNTASSSLRSGNFKTSFSWAAGLGKNVNVISQTMRTCMQIPCTHEAPFTARLSSVPQPQLSALTRQSGNSKLMAWIRLWHTGRSTLSCAHKTACVRARTQWRWTQTTVTLPSPFQVSSLWLSGGWVQEDDSKPWETFACPAWNEYLSCSANSKLSSTLAEGVTLVRKASLTASRCRTSNGVSLQKRRPNASTDDRSSTRKVLFSFR